MHFNAAHYWHSTHRIGRMAFVITALPLLVMCIVVGAWRLNGLSVGVAAIAYLALAHATLCVCSLRLHDCGVSGWWSWLVVLAAGLRLDLLAPHSLATTEAFGLLPPAIILFALAVIPGQAGHNRFGTAPDSRA